MLSQTTSPAVEVIGLTKNFTLHAQGSLTVPALNGVSFSVGVGECLALNGPPGSGKSTVLKLIYGNYRSQTGRILLRHEGTIVDIACAGPRELLRIRRRSIGYVSQSLRVVPRVPALEVVAEPLRELMLPADTVEQRVRSMLDRVGIPARLFGASPSTFHATEQKRVSLARAFIHEYPLLLLDEPTAMLDPASRETVIGLIREAKQRGATVIAALTDDDACEALAARRYPLPIQELAREN